MATSLKELMNAPMRAGRLDWIGLRPVRRGTLTAAAISRRTSTCGSAGAG